MHFREWPPTRVVEIIDGNVGEILRDQLPAQSLFETRDVKLAGELGVGFAPHGIAHHVVVLNGTAASKTLCGGAVLDAAAMAKVRDVFGGQCGRSA